MTRLLSINGICLNSRIEPFTLEMKKGDCIGLLGINGTGKSTLLALIAGGLSASGGEVLIDGKQKATKSKNQIGWLRQHSSCYPEMTVKENLIFYAAIQQLDTAERKSSIAHMMQQFSLEKLQARLAKNLSGGELRRLDLACAIVHDPEILLLDEPSSGLDPQQSDELRELIKTISPDRAVLIASHILPDIEKTCQRAILLNQGKQLSSSELVDTEQYIQAHFVQPPSDDELLKLTDIKKVIRREGDRIVMQLATDSSSIVPEKLSNHGWGLKSCQAYQQGIAELFKKISSGDDQ